MKKQVQKPQYTRKEVLEYLEKVKYKAVKAVEDEYEKRYDDVFNDLIDQNPELNALIDNSVELVAQLGKMSERVAEIVKSAWHPKYGYHSGNFTRYANINLIAEICENYVDEAGVLQGIKDEREKRIGEVEQTYKAVELTLRGMTSPAKMRDYLDGLGFDTSYLDRISTPALPAFDPTKLFPCKERGLLTDSLG
jgi:hypothetical protein